VGGFSANPHLQTGKRCNHEPQFQSGSAPGKVARYKLIQQFLNRVPPFTRVMNISFDTFSSSCGKNFLPSRVVVTWQCSKIKILFSVKMYAYSYPTVTADLMKFFRYSCSSSAWRLTGKPGVKLKLTSLIISALKWSELSVLGLKLRCPTARRLSGP